MKTNFLSALSIEREILLAARKVVQNPRLKMTEIMEWAFGEVKPQSGEVTVYLDAIGCNICLRQESDRRPNQAAEMLVVEKAK